MAFGTGHHETTAMVIKIMSHLDLKNLSVFDYGCGTGILAILSSMMGADRVLAIDYDINSYNNTLENLKTNKVSNVHTMHGTIEDIPNETFDLILANINRKVLTTTCKQIYKRCNRGGEIIISGFLISDEELIEKTFRESGFLIEETMNKGEWLAKRLKRL